MRRATSVQEFARLFAGGSRIRTSGPLNQSSSAGVNAGRYGDVRRTPDGDPFFLQFRGSGGLR
jgi:hypothetical protein